MKDFIIYPHKEYLNLEYKSIISSDNIKKVHFISEKYNSLSLINPDISTHAKLIKVPGTYNVYVNDEKSPKETITAENTINTRK